MQEAIKLLSDSTIIAFVVVGALIILVPLVSLTIAFLRLRRRKTQTVYDYLGAGMSKEMKKLLKGFEPEIFDNCREVLLKFGRLALVCILVRQLSGLTLKMPERVCDLYDEAKATHPQAQEALDRLFAMLLASTDGVDRPKDSAGASALSRS